MNLLSIRAIAGTLRLKTRPTGWLLAGWMALSVALPTASNAQVLKTNHGAGIFKSLTVQERLANSGDNRVHVGDHVDVRIRVVNLDGVFTGAPAFVIPFPDATNAARDTLLFTNITDTIHYPTPVGDTTLTLLSRTVPNAVVLTNLYDVTRSGPPDQNVAASYFLTNYTYTVLPAAASTNRLFDDARTVGIDTHDFTAGETQQVFTLTFPNQLVVFAPAICCSSSCVGIDRIGTNNVVTVSVTVTNCSHNGTPTPLTNVVVTNILTGVGGFTNRVFGAAVPNTLASNGTATFTFTYTNNNSGVLSNVVSVYGTDEIGLTVSTACPLIASNCIPLGCIGDFVWNDLNMDGIQQTNISPFEPGVPGVTVRLMNCAGSILGTTITDAGGRYLFCGLTAGTYRVMFDHPNASRFTFPNVGTDDCVDSDADTVTGLTTCITLAPGEINLCVDAGIVITNGCIGDFVWEDRNTNGVQETNAPLFEPGIPGVTVRLLNCAGAILQTTTTDINGRYLFCGLTGGSYRVLFDRPNGYRFTLPNVPPDDCLDSDADPASGLSACITLATGEINLCVDAGLVPTNCPHLNLICPANQLVECGILGSPTNIMNLTNLFTPPWTTGGGGGVTIMVVTNQIITNAPCPNKVSIIRVWKATDACSNSAVCSQTISVVDTTPPNITCGDNQLVECNQPVNFTPPFAVDACDGTNVVIRLLGTTTTPVSPRCPGLTNITRTWSATDTCGNSNICSQTITIIDTTPPNITCAHDQIVECGTPFAFTPPFAVDACDGTNVTIRILSTVATPVSPRCPGLTNIVRTWSASDSCGNSNVCSQTITIVDTTPPNIVCAANQTVECGNPFAFTPPFAVDICDGTNVTIRILSTVTTPVTPRCPGLTNIVRTWSASDSCGNSNVCSQTITIVDTMPPKITCADNLIVECGTPFAFIPPFAVDTCDGTNVTIRIVSTVTTPANPRCPGLTNIVRTWSATDSCGNSNMCSQTITLVDTTPPNITCADNQIVECGNPFAFIPPFAVDICDGTNVTIRIVSTVQTPANPRCPGLTNVVRTWSATDSCGNSNMCSQTITLVDTTPPNITCAHDQIVECGNPFAFTPPFAVDICDGTNVTIRIVSTVSTPVSPRCPGLTNIVRTWSATDSCGNSNMCSQTITLVDTTPPNITCGDNLIVECGTAFAFTPPFAVDACDGTNVTIRIVSTVQTPASPRCPGLTNIVRTWSATDSCGNSNMCSQTITLVDTRPPNIICGEDQVVECGFPLTFDPPFAVDICDGTNVTIRIVSTVFTPASPRCPGLTNVVRTWSATDSCGNSNVCSQVILLVDTRPPVITCPPQQIVECGVPFTFLMPYATDLCSGTNVTITPSVPVTNKVHCGYSVNIVWTARDQCNNSASCNATILAQDTLPPSIMCGGNKIVECGGAIVFDPPMAWDLCDGTNVLVYIVSTVTNVPSPGVTNFIRTWKAFDSCSNMASCSQQITTSNCAPCIDVTKTIACLFPNNQCGTFGKSATGYRSTNANPALNVNPAFCYSITVSNCGVATLTNVTVIDDKLGDLTSSFFPAGKLTPLAPGGTITMMYKMAWGVTTTNTVIAAGKAAAPGATMVMATNGAIAYVYDLSITCEPHVTSPDDTDNLDDNSVTLPADGEAHVVTFTMRVCNQSSANLVVVLRTPGLGAYGCSDPAPFSLAAGACQTVQLCVANLTCDQDRTFNTIVSGYVDTTQGQCGYDIHGSNIVVQTADCPMYVKCESHGACRVTGGGRQENTYPPVRYMTHGGQVGAPVGREGFDPGTFEREGSVCIHGNWEVVRHEKGGNRGNFHAKIYDSLMCACLGCPENPQNPNGVVLGGLCNPGDRICGPEPRKAPANKICFSGIGDFAMTSGNRVPRSVLFRVDIEDRSEPGNNGKPSEDPPDRHRIRIWILTPAELAQLNNPGDRLLTFRRAISAVNGATALQDGAIGANGLAVPLGTQVFGVRAPDIDDGGEMDHGNHQIHPMIKDCK